MGLRGIKHFVFSLSLAALLAVLVVMARTPEGVPVVNPDAVLDAPPITDDMEAQQQVPGAHRLTYTENQVNAFLEFCVRGKEGRREQFRAEVRARVRAFRTKAPARSRPSIRCSDTRSTRRRSTPSAFKTAASCRKTLGGGFGRLAVPAKAMKYLDTIFSPVWNLLDHDQRLLSQMQAVNFHKESVEMITRPTAGH